MVNLARCFWHRLKFQRFLHCFEIFIYYSLYYIPYGLLKINSWLADLLDKSVKCKMKGCFEFKGTFTLKWRPSPHFMPANFMAYLCIKGKQNLNFWCPECSCNFNKWLGFNYAKEMADMEKLPNSVHIFHTMHDIIAWKLSPLPLSSLSAWWWLILQNKWMK